MAQQTEQDGEPTLRFAMAEDLLAGMPQLAADIEARPDKPQLPTMDFVKSLVESGTPEEALTVCAYAMPARRGVWWGHECLMRVQQGLTEQDATFMKMAADWVADPSEERRNHLVAAAYPGAGPVLPGQWLALGGGWSAGSMNPSDQPELPVAQHLSPTAIHVGVLCALAKVDISERANNLQSFVKMACQLTEA